MADAPDCRLGSALSDENGQTDIPAALAAGRPDARAHGFTNYENFEARGILVA
ncbi:hypothetical protein [Candidatus Poriferisodalis sp.]|uniref:hypothetical protein n=1 Tax=Candidatus Poriferisodalis sp. TaxID=3101277 RepID=UPI003B018AF1